MQLTQRRREDGGFTLIELLITTVIIGIISAALAGVVISYLQTSVSARTRTTESMSVQLAAAYWQRDVASVGVRSYDPNSKTFPLKQSVDLTPACALPAGTPVVTLAWSNYTSTDSTVLPGVITVSYLARSRGSVFDLVRVRCTASTVDSTVVVAHNLTAPPSKSCGGSCVGEGSSVPTVITLGLTVRDPDRTGATYDTTLTGERRQT